LFQIPNGSDDFDIFHVACWIIVEADCENASVSPLRSLDDFMEILEIIVISR
jgi:hypothetical protein